MSHMWNPASKPTGAASSRSWFTPAWSGQGHPLSQSHLAQREKAFPCLCLKTEVELSQKLLTALSCPTAIGCGRVLKGGVLCHSEPWDWMRSRAACWQITSFVMFTKGILPLGQIMRSQHCLFSSLPQVLQLNSLLR